MNGLQYNRLTDQEVLLKLQEIKAETAEHWDDPNSDVDVRNAERLIDELIRVWSV